MKSVRGCLTCRRRKRKCDEVRPVCGQCRDSKRVCQTSDLIFRHHSHDPPQRAGAETRKAPERARIPPASPAKVVGTVVNSPQPSHSGPSAPASGPDLSMSPTCAHSPSTAAPTPSRVELPWDPVHAARLSPAMSFSPGCPTIKGSVPSILSPLATDKHATEVETDSMIGHLLKYFSEKPGPWLDLYFLEPHFQQDVPRKALSHPLLKHAVCAYAAKHLHRTRQSPARKMLPLMGSEGRTAWYDSPDVDFAWHSAKHYTLAITILRETIQQSATPGEPVKSPEDAGMQQHAANAGVITDEVMAAMAILGCYEYMSASDAEWLRHLSGTMLLLQLQKSGEHWGHALRPSRAKRSIFWNYARQDLYGAFILGGETRLDTEDYDIWRAAGLTIDTEGLIDLSTNGDTESMSDDMISNALLWIFCKVVNYSSISKRDGATATESLSEKWFRLSRELDTWHRGLPDSFKPLARYDIPYDLSAVDDSRSATGERLGPFPCTCFSSRMCASTIQTYHLVKIVLLTQRPQDAVSPTNYVSGISTYVERLRSHHAELQHRAREIFTIAMASATEACIYLHQTQTLFVAGQCLVDIREQKVVVDLLRRVNVELGWETQYRIDQLYSEWGVSAFADT